MHKNKSPPLITAEDGMNRGTTSVYRTFAGTISSGTTLICPDALTLIMRHSLLTDFN